MAFTYLAKVFELMHTLGYNDLFRLAKSSCYIRSTPRNLGLRFRRGTNAIYPSDKYNSHITTPDDSSCIPKCEPLSFVEVFVLTGPNASAYIDYM